jgi:hypothetical protein
MTAESWLPTPAAARALGVSTRTLKRYAHPNSGFLLPGVHWAAGPYANSTTRWDVEACRTLLHRRGLAARLEVRPELRLQDAR